MVLEIPGRLFNEGFFNKSPGDGQVGAWFGDRFIPGDLLNTIT